MSKLENQIDRMLMLIQANTQKIEFLEQSVRNSEDKTANLTRLARLQQTYSENNEAEIQKLKHIIMTHKPNTNDFPCKNQVIQRLDRIEGAVSDDRIQNCEQRISSVEINKAEFSDLETKITHKVGRAIDHMFGILDKYTKIQKKMKSDITEIRRTIQNKSLAHLKDEEDDIKVWRKDFRIKQRLSNASAGCFTTTAKTAPTTLKMKIRKTQSKKF